MSLQISNNNEPLSWPVLAQRVVIGVLGTVTVAAGAMVLADNTKVQLHEQRLSKIEDNIAHLPEIDRNVIVLSGKLDVVNQKLDDAQARSLAVNVARAGLLPGPKK